MAIWPVPARGGQPRALALEAAMQEVAQTPAPGHWASLDLTHLICEVGRITCASRVWK